jgi:hypothetical protein
MATGEASVVWLKRKVGFLFHKIASILNPKMTGEAPIITGNLSVYLTDIPFIFGCIIMDKTGRL